MSDDVILVEIDGSGVGWLTLNRPATHNAFDDALIARMTEALEGLGANADVRAVVLAANGKSFSAGADLGWMRRVAEYTFEQNVDDAMGLARMLRTLDRLPKPTIARVQGAALGGGVGLVAACDIAIAADTATFALTEVKLGLVPGAISPYVIAAIGARQARRYFPTAERFDAVRALEMGLVHMIAPADGLDGAVGEVLETLAANGPQSMAAAKDLVYAIAGRPIDEDVMRESAERIARARASDEGRARVQAFLDRRRGG